MCWDKPDEFYSDLNMCPRLLTLSISQTTLKPKQVNEATSYEVNPDKTGQKLLLPCSIVCKYGRKGWSLHEWRRESVHMLSAYEGSERKKLRRGGWWLLPAILRASPLIFLLIILRKTPVITGRNWFAKTYSLKMQVNWLWHAQPPPPSPPTPSITDTRRSRAA